MSFWDRHKTTIAFLSLLLLYIISLLVNLGTLQFSGEEPRRAMISVEMMEAGNYIRPTQYGWNYYNKPPVFNWILVAVIWLTGSASEFVLRLPAILFYMLMAFVHFRISRHFFPKQIALLSAFFILTCADIYTYGLAYGVEIDIFYSFLVYIQAISIFWFYTRRQYAQLFLVSYLFCAIGFLTKAFPSIVFQGLTLGALCVYARSWKVLFKWQHLAGIVLFVLVAGGYFFLYSQYSSPVRFLINLLNEATLKSGVGERSDRLIEKALNYPWLFVKMFFPWSFLLLLLFKRIGYQFRKNPLTWFSILFILFNIGVYWFTGKPKIRYVYMFVPFGCTILVHIYHCYTQVHASFFNRILGYLGYIFFLPLAVIIALPFFGDASLAWVVVLVVAFIALLSVYYRQPANRIWLFLVGVILLRLVYAALFLPLQRREIESYQDHIAKVVKGTKKENVQYWADPLTFPVEISTSVFKFHSEDIKTPSVLPLEIPYYYYRSTGHIIRFDTVKKYANYFIAFSSQIGDKKIDTIYAYNDRNLGQRIVFYKLKDTADQAR